MMKRFLPLIILSLFFISCDLNQTYKAEAIQCSEEIKQRAFNFAALYRDSETEYEWGGQDPVRNIKIDCSGLIIMCYKYALVDTNYSLLRDDMSSSYIYENASVKTEKPSKGDLIFMGASDSDNITHIAILDRIEDAKVYFIDSTLRDADDSWNIDVNGVTERYYPADSPYIKSYGIMLLKKD